MVYTKRRQLYLRFFLFFNIKILLLLRFLVKCLVAVLLTCLLKMLVAIYLNKEIKTWIFLIIYHINQL
jgi:hypothetical protein